MKRGRGRTPTVDLKGVFPKGVGASGLPAAASAEAKTKWCHCVFCETTCACKSQRRLAHLRACSAMRNRMPAGYNSLMQKLWKKAKEAIDEPGTLRFTRTPAGAVAFAEPAAGEGGGSAPRRNPAERMRKAYVKWVARKGLPFGVMTDPSGRALFDSIKRLSACAARACARHA